MHFPYSRHYKTMRIKNCAPRNSVWQKKIMMLRWKQRSGNWFCILILTPCAGHSTPLFSPIVYVILCYLHYYVMVRTGISQAFSNVALQPGLQWPHPWYRLECRLICKTYTHCYATHFLRSKKICPGSPEPSDTIEWQTECEGLCIYKLLCSCSSHDAEHLWTGESWLGTDMLLVNAEHLLEQERLM